MTEPQAFYGKLVQAEISGEDYAKNKQRDREDAIADAVNELKVRIRVMLASYYLEFEPSLAKETGFHLEAIEKIKEYL